MSSPWGAWSPSTIHVLDAAIDGLATARLTRLITTDTILERPRHWWMRRHPLQGQLFLDRHGRQRDASVPVGSTATDSVGRTIEVGVSPETGQREWVYAETDKLGELIVCPWCIGMYVALGVTLLRRSRVAWLWDPVARMLALSEVAGQLRAHEGSE